MSAEYLSSLAGVVLALLFGYVPGLSSWFDGLDGIYKRLVMLVLLVAVAVAIVGLACVPYGTFLGISVTCDQQGFVEVLKAFVAALIANQSTYLISSKSKSR